MEEEKRSLLLGRQGEPKKKKEVASVRGVVRVLAIAFAVFVLSSAASRSIASFAGQHEDSVAFVSGTMNEDLVDPRNGSHPTRTTTSECTGQTALPVLAGADVVAYFSMPAGSEHVTGTGHIRTTHNGYLFFFSSVENRQAFEANPYKYIPAWGGFCSYGIAAEAVWNVENLGPFGDPSYWKILSDGRLHIFRSETPMRNFNADPEAYLARGEAIWQGWFGDTGGPLNTACFCSPAICDDK